MLPENKLLWFRIILSWRHLRKQFQYELSVHPTSTWKQNINSPDESLAPSPTFRTKKGMTMLSSEVRHLERAHTTKSYLLALIYHCFLYVFVSMLAITEAQTSFIFSFLYKIILSWNVYNASLNMLKLLFKTQVLTTPLSMFLPYECTLHMLINLHLFLLIHLLAVCHLLSVSPYRALVREPRKVEGTSFSSTAAWKEISIN